MWQSVFFSLSAVTEDLESQLRDLQEVNEATVANLQQAEKELEIARLSRTSSSMRHLEEENRRLRTQVRKYLRKGRERGRRERERR